MPAYGMVGSEKRPISGEIARGQGIFVEAEVMPDLMVERVEDLVHERLMIVAGAFEVALEDEDRVGKTRGRIHPRLLRHRHPHEQTEQAWVHGRIEVLEDALRRQ